METASQINRRLGSAGQKPRRALEDMLADEKK
jgi:hypothetical protein